MDGKKMTGAKVTATLMATERWQIHVEKKTRSANPMVTWEHTWQRKDKRALRAKAHVARLWQKLRQGLQAGRVNGKSLGKASQGGTLQGHMILYAAVGLHKRLLKLCYMQGKSTFSSR